MSKSLELAVEIAGKRWYGQESAAIPKLIVFTPSELETFYRRAQAQVLRDAAELCENICDDDGSEYGDAVRRCADELRIMADKLK